MKVRILAPEATIGESKVYSGEQVEVTDKVAGKLIKSGYAIEIAPQSKAVSVVTENESAK